MGTIAGVLIRADGSCAGPCEGVVRIRMLPLGWAKYCTLATGGARSPPSPRGDAKTCLPLALRPLR